MKIQIIDRNKNFIDACKGYFNDDENVSLIHGNPFDHKTDFIVSPANSFGFMDGGFDLHLSDYFGWRLEERIQNYIKCHCAGEVAVGDGFIENTYNKNIPFVIFVPTMRVPEDVSETINAYLAAKKAFQLFKRASHPLSPTITMTGLCTGFGQMPVKRSAKQIYYAYNQVFNPTECQTLAQAMEEHKLLIS